MLTYREEFRLHGALTPERQEALIDLLEQVQAQCEYVEDKLLDPPAESHPAYAWYECWWEIHNTTYGE